MSRAARLMDLIDRLRQHRAPVSGRALAEALGVSLRTLYRDIETLKAQGADIRGEAGLGYVLKPGFLLPPLMFSEDEVAALMLGMQWVAEQADETLADAAERALTRIGAVLPEHLRDRLEDDGLIVGPMETAPDSVVTIDSLRSAMAGEVKLRLAYVDAAGAPTTRTIWPIALAFFNAARVLVAWCELRQDFRHFRLDRMAGITVTETRYPRRRRALLREWRATLDEDSDIG